MRRARTWLSAPAAEWWLPLLAFTLLALVVTHPLWLHLDTAVPSDIGDPLLNTWILAWDVHALTVNPAGLFDAGIFFPLPNTLAYSEHLLGTAATVFPVLWLTGEPIVAYNVAYLLSFILGGWGTYLLVRRHTRSAAAAFLAGVAFACFPYRITAFSHLQLLTLQWLPLSLLCLEGLGDAGTRRVRHDGGVRGRPSALVCAVAFAVLLWLQIATSWHLAVFAGVTVALYAIGWWLRLPRAARLSAVLYFAGAAAAVALLTWPLVAPYLASLPQLQHARPAEIAAGFGAQPGDYLAAPPWNRTLGPLTAPLAGRSGFTEENFTFIGLVGLALAAAGVWDVFRRRDRDARILVVTWLGIALVAWVLSWGPYAAIGPWRVPLPYLWLSRLSGVFGLIRVPPRWMIAAGLPLAALAGFGARRVLGTCARRVGTTVRESRRLQRAVLFTVIGAMLVLESWSVPLPLAEVGRSADLAAVYRWLAAQPGDFAVLEWPLHVAPRPEYPETKRLYAATLHWKPLVNGYSGFTPERQTALDAELSGFPDERALAALRDLGRQGVRYLLVHTLEQGFDRDRWEETSRWVLERSATTIPAYDDGADLAYAINPWGDEWVTAPASVPDAAWRERAPLPADERWQDGLVCLAYQCAEAAGGAGYVDLYWQRQAPFRAGVFVFVHLLDPGGQIVAQGDGPMVDGHFPTSDWSPGEVVRDRHVLVPIDGGDIGAGTQLRIGLYYPDSGERIPVLGEGDLVRGDYVLLPWEPEGR